MKTRKAFTLIELLIVVAIIAILAAIAIPNFLEAQVRSKVSRVKADMRSVATAIEAYAVDNRHYPIHNDAYNVSSNPNPTDQSGGDYPTDHFRVSSWMTTPIAYITSLPLDPFISAGDGSINNSGLFKPPDVSRRISYWDIEWIYSYLPNNGEYRNFYNNIGGWFMYSWGPDKEIKSDIRKWHDQSGGQPPYDPTNGTVSIGNIYRSPKYTDTPPPKNFTLVNP